MHSFSLSLSNKMREEARRRLQEADPELKIVSGRRRKERLIPAVPRILSPEEAKQWGLPEMIPYFPSEEVLAIESKWSKKELEEMATEYFLDPRGDKERLIIKLLYVGALDKEGERTELPTGGKAVAPYIIGNPSKFCCSICGDCALAELLERGRFLDRISWLREHYKINHPGKWGKGKSR